MSKTDQPHKYVNLNVPLPLYEKLETVASGKDMTVPELIRQAAAFALENME